MKNAWKSKLIFAVIQRRVYSVNTTLLQLAFQSRSTSNVNLRLLTLRHHSVMESCRFMHTTQFWVFCLTFARFFKQTTNTCQFHGAQHSDKCFGLNTRKLWDNPATGINVFLRKHGHELRLNYTISENLKNKSYLFRLEKFELSWERFCLWIK